MDAYLKVNDELNSLRDQLGTEQRDLAALNAQYEQLCRATVDNPEAALEAAVLPQQREMIKARIHGLGMRIGSKEAELAVLYEPIAARMRQAEEEAAKAKWEGILAQCRKVRDECDEIEVEVRVATKEAADAQEAFEYALAELDEYRATPLDPLDSITLTPTKLASARRRDTQLQNAVREAMAARDAAAMKRGGIWRQWQDACQELAKLAWQERHYRPQGIREAATAATLGEAMARR